MTQPPPERVAHLCLTGGWFSSYNVGDQAILLGITDAFSALGPTRFSVITANPVKVRAQYGLPAFAPRRTPLRLLRNLLGADALVFTGGTPFYDAWPHMSYYATLAAVAHARGLPIVVLGISLRTLKNPYCRWLMRRIVGWATLLGAREGRTYDTFHGLGAVPAKVRLIPDLAIQMQPADPSVGAAILRAAGGDPQARNIAICLRDFRADAAFQRHHYSRAYDPATLDRYQSAIRALTEYAVRDLGCNVVFCPMHTVAPDDDRRVAREIVAAIPDGSVRARVTLVERQCDPREMKALLGLMEANVGVRFHSLVLSTAMAVPTLAVAYAHKNRAFMDYVGEREQVCDLGALNPGDLCARLTALLGRRDQAAERLRLRYGRIHADFREEIAAIRRLLPPPAGAAVDHGLS